MKTIAANKNTNKPINDDFKEWESFIQEIKIDLEPKIEEEVRIYNHIAWAELMYKFFNNRPFAA